MLLEVCLIGIEHSVEPGEELVRAVVRVEDDGAAKRQLPSSY